MSIPQPEKLEFKARWYYLPIALFSFLSYMLLWNPTALPESAREIMQAMYSLRKATGLFEYFVYLSLLFSGSAGWLYANRERDLYKAHIGLFKWSTRGVFAAGGTLLGSALGTTVYFFMYKTIGEAARGLGLTSLLALFTLAPVYNVAFIVDMTNEHREMYRNATTLRMRNSFSLLSALIMFVGLGGVLFKVVGAGV